MPFFAFRRKEVPWEVVISNVVDPVPMYDEDEELDIVRVSRTDMSRQSVYELKDDKDLRRAVHFARHQLMQDILHKHYNVMLSEGWQVNLLRKGKRLRVEVIYTARPAYAAGKSITYPPPPFMGVLDHCQRGLSYA